MNVGTAYGCAPRPHTYVLYHRDADGFASAFAAWCALGYAGVTYISVQYGEPLPAMADGSRVFIVDFSYKRTVLMDLCQRMREVVVLDHHKTAEEELRGLACATFDMEKAGCQLAWDYFSNPAVISENAPAAELLAEPLPWLLAAVADRDLWKFALPATAEISAALELRKWDFDLWRAMCDYDREAQDSFILEGHTCIMHQSMAVRRMANHKHPIGLRGENGKTLVVIGCNAALWQSECAHYLLKSDCGPVVACYAMEEKGIRVSLRGDGTVDVSAIAKRYESGGGHHNAAGFFYPTDPLTFTKGQPGPAEEVAP